MTAAELLRRSSFAIRHLRPLAFACLLPLLLTSCAFLSATPPLPKAGAIETTSATRADELTDLASRADIFYLPDDHLRSGIAGRILRALLLGPTPPVIGIAAMNPIVSDSGNDLPTGYRSVLREAEEARLHVVGLGCAQDDYTCVASNIVAQYHSNPTAKLLVVIERHAFDVPDSVPVLVAQKAEVRQLVLETQPPARRSPQLMTWRARHLQIVDRAPLTGGNRL